MPDMPAGEVVAVLDAMAARAVDVWVDGGWGVDALLGRQTRGRMPTSTSSSPCAAQR